MASEIYQNKKNEAKKPLRWLKTAKLVNDRLVKLYQKKDWVGEKTKQQKNKTRFKRLTDA